MAEPLTLEQAKAQLRVLDEDEDDLIGAAIVDARGWIENYTGRSFAEIVGDDEVPPVLLRAMRLLVAGFYGDRETGGLAGDVEVSARRLCGRFKVRKL
ncbi:hypothetical protein GCM10007897_15080 [Sphingobium jiangsuense]|uniref:Phage gp6-like head-tail connector protein n=1 Tax=Sphingobium jiangsuense TaxID=870476 RepID=A0A7W6FNZ9_9SPHN|nr:head-tail connector protein [Sphingobium jiangsuense]MBB3925047.1 hypothetical protein [Sphingobium jiangsuense]GLT00124.1 hypothetical protein GCM10007897_15080 [Sphingobium jiangsuense]